MVKESSNLRKLVKQGGDVMKSVGQEGAEISVIVSYIICGLFVFIGVSLIIYGLIPSAPFNCDSDIEQKQLDFCNNSKSSDCSKQQKELDGKNSKCVKKTIKFLPFGVIGIVILFIGIGIVLISKWNKNLVKNNPKIAAVEGLATTANIIGGMFHHRM
jgi:hypothetical protein